jgi:hypothetical protein
LYGFSARSLASAAGRPGSTAQVATALRALKWDSDELEELRTEHVVAILERFLRGDLHAEDVCLWADLVEGREDVALEQTHEEVLKDVVFQLATPEVEGPLDAAVARSLIARLK